MQALLGGSAIGVIGLLAGAVFALWWRSECEKYKGTAHLLKFKLDEETDEHERTLKAAQANAEEYTAAVGRKDELLKFYKERLDAAKERSVAGKSLSDLVRMANSLDGLPGDKPRVLPPVSGKDG